MDLHPDASLALGRMSPQQPVRPGDVLAERLRLSPGRPGRRARPVHGRPDRAARVCPPSGSRRFRSGASATRSTRPRATPTPCARRLGSRRRSSRCTRETSAWPTRSTSSSRRPGGSATAPTSSFCSSATGRGWPRCKAARDREELANIRLLDYVPRSQLQASLALADVHLISMRPEMTGIVVPGKLYGVMAAGRPAIFVGPEHCESADTIRDAGCGITVRSRRHRWPGGSDSATWQPTRVSLAHG